VEKLEVLANASQPVRKLFVACYPAMKGALEYFPKLLTTTFTLQEEYNREMSTGARDFLIHFDN